MRARAPLWVWAMLVVGLSLAGTGLIAQVQARPEAPPEVRPFVKGSLDAITAERRGEPFLLVFWSMYCAPCIEEMETWKTLHETREDFRLVMVATDPIDKADKLSHILDFKGIGWVERWAFADSMTARVRFDVDPKWRGELPRIHFVDAQGRHEPVIGRVGAERVTDWLDTH